MESIALADGGMGAGGGGNYGASVSGRSNPESSFCQTNPMWSEQALEVK